MDFTKVPGFTKQHASLLVLSLDSTYQFLSDQSAVLRRKCTGCIRKSMEERLVEREIEDRDVLMKQITDLRKEIHPIDSTNHLSHL